MKPILFEFGPVTIYSYGTLLAIGFLVATTLAMRHAKHEGISSGRILDLFLIVLITGIIGSRILYVVLNWPDFSQGPLKIFFLNKGGLAIYGGFALSIPIGMWFIAKSGLPFWKTLDLISPYAALAHFFGRIGCFLNGCCYGKATNSFLGVYFPNHYSKIHPTQLYSSLGLLSIFFILKYCYKKRTFEGEVFFSYLILYSVFRFFIERLRGDSPIFIFDFTFYQCLSIVLFIVAIISYVLRRSACRTTLL